MDIISEQERAGGSWCFVCLTVIVLLLFLGSCPAWEQIPQESGTGCPLAQCSAQGPRCGTGWVLVLAQGCCCGASKCKCFQDYKGAREGEQSVPVSGIIPVMPLVPSQSSTVPWDEGKAVWQKMSSPH